MSEFGVGVFLTAVALIVCGFAFAAGYKTGADSIINCVRGGAPAVYCGIKEPSP